MAKQPTPLSDLGDWKDIEGYPMYKISSTGAVMNKRTLKILKHYRCEDLQVPCVTLYESRKMGRPSVGEVFPVKTLLAVLWPGAKVAKP